MLRVLLGAICFVVIGMLVLVALTPFRGHARARHIEALTEIASIKVALAAFRNDAGFYPTGTDGLLDLVRQPPGATNWRGPYLQRTNLPLDPWARHYIYRCPGGHSAEGYPYDVLSLGQPGKNKPIANWAYPALRP